MVSMFVSSFKPALFSARMKPQPHFGRMETVPARANPSSTDPAYLWKVLEPELEREHFKDQHPQVNSDFWHNFGQLMKRATPLQRDVLAWEKGRYFNPLATPEQLQFICQADDFAAKAALEARRQELARTGDPEKACQKFAETIFSTYGNLLKHTPMGQAYVTTGNQARGLPPPVFKPAAPTRQMNQLA